MSMPSPAFAVPAVGDLRDELVDLLMRAAVQGQRVPADSANGDARNGLLFRLPPRVP